MGVMPHRYPLPLHHSWPLFDRARHFDLGWVERAGMRPPDAAVLGSKMDDSALAAMGIGRWHCDLDGDRLTWSNAVYDMFGLARDVAVTRPYAVAHYCERSRAAMERLRAHAIAHRRGFTLDVEIGPALAQPRWMRLVAAPVCVGDEVVALHGLKRLLSD